MKLLKRVLPATAAAVLVLAGLAACSSSSPAANPAGPSSGAPAAAIPLLRVGTAFGTSTLNPLTTQGCATDYCGLFMERLMKFSPDGRLEPELAASMTEPNSVTYEFHLRHGVRFWDGHEMTSADVVASLEYQEAPGSETATYYTDVKSITADGRYTVVVTLKQPDSIWPQNMAYEGVIFEKSFEEAHKATFGRPGTLVMGTGPWEIKSLDPTRGMELSANPHWWGGKVPVQHISVKFFSTETSEALAMRAGEIDVAFPQGGKSFTASSGAKVTSWSAPGINFFAMDAKVGPWADVHVRRAVAYALNRTAIIAANGGPSTAAPATEIISPSQLLTLGTQSQVNALLTALPQYPYDLAKARQEMAESAYPHGFSAVTETANLASFPTVLQVIVAELQQIGISLKVQETSVTKWIADADSTGTPPGGDMYISLGAVSPDPSILPSYMVGSAATYNTAHYAPAAANSLLAQGVATSDGAQRLAIYGRLLNQVATDVPYVPLFSAYSFTALSSKYTLPPFPDYAAFFSWALGIKAVS
jgi:peptide/nickel transport system substrate-binding protein